MRYDVIVVGAGAAGLVAAERAASRGLRTLLLEKNRHAGVKILMSGGTRCNLTQATDVRGIVKEYGPPGRFLHSALASLGPRELVALVEAEGVPTKVEETGKIFPASDKAADVLEAFLRRLRRTPCELALGEPVTTLERAADGFALATPLRQLACTCLIITTGGQSYPGSGTSGDAYAWARQLGHTVVTPRPALTPITTHADWVRGLSGITLPDVAVRVIDPAATKTGKKRAGELAARRGSFLFTHFGLSGPVVLDVSRVVSGHVRPQTLLLECDFVPAMSEADLLEHWQRAAAGAGARQLGGAMPEALPRRLGEALLDRLQLAPERRLAELSKADRNRLVEVIKHCPIPISGTRGFGKAEVTAGGVSLDEVDSRTMQSKLVPGLYWAGEVLDLDGPIGGYNFQAAFSTGWLAGSKVAPRGTDAES